MQDSPFISIIIPCRNEHKFISKCLDSILVNNYPENKMEIFIVDGMSADGTREIINNYAKKYPFIHLIDNPRKITPVALNIAVKKSIGDIIIRMDSHTTYDKNYIKKCVEYLKEYDADNVGGVIKTISMGNSLMSKSINACMSNFFGTGNSYFRIGAQKPMQVDTVPFGCYKKEVFDRVGLFNESLERSQDLEFNMRLKKAGGKIYLCPDIIGYYYPKSKLTEFMVHNFKDGVWVTYPLKFIKMPFRPRHYVPLIFVLLLIVLALLGFVVKPFFYLFLSAILFYLFCLVYFSVKVSILKKDFTLLIFLPAAFAVRHFSYGFGELWGILLLLIKPKLK